MPVKPKPIHRQTYRENVPGMAMAGLRDRVQSHPGREPNLVVLPAFKRSVNPVGKKLGERQARLEGIRAAEKAAAYSFLVNGVSEDGQFHGSQPPSYGKSWDREYNPMPYPEAVPEIQSAWDHDPYVGTGIGLLYGRVAYLGDGTQINSNHHVGSLAGWTITRKGQEVRSKGRK